MKYIKMNGQTFEVIYPRDYENKTERYRNYSGLSLWSWYDHWSQIKEDIYEEWKMWFIQTDHVMSMGICSANNNTFTITGILTNDDLDEIGRFVITKCHNKLYLKPGIELPTED